MTNRVGVLAMGLALLSCDDGRKTGGPDGDVTSPDGSDDGDTTIVTGDADAVYRYDADVVAPEGSWIEGAPGDERPLLEGEVTIVGVGSFAFEPSEIETSREDLFRPGFFSVFDVLVHLADRGEIQLDANFDPDLDTHLIESLNGISNWWYFVYYHGGWLEGSDHRMDYYPVKDHMFISFEEVPPSEFERREMVWRTEVERRATNGGGVIVPEVEIRMPDDEVLQFREVEITSHQLRGDMFVVGTVTAADVIMSLADDGELTYGMLWTESIGPTIARNYYVEAINEHRHTGRCGFVYEVGERDSRFGNHIHVTPDMRVLQSPGYVLFFWIRLGPC